MAIMKMMRTRKREWTKKIDTAVDEWGQCRGSGQGRGWARAACASCALCKLPPVYYESERERRAADFRAGTARTHEREGAPTPNLRKEGGAGGAEAEVVTALVTASASPPARPRLSVASRARGAILHVSSTS
jgi:hypothetical protein